MTFGLFSDIHYSNKPYRLRSALRQLNGADVILIAGDLADRGTEQQFSDILAILTEEVPNTAVFPVCGNHDLRKDSDTYREFEESVFRRFSEGCSVEKSRTGAYCVRLEEETDLIGLNPLYYRKLFHFPEHGEQLDFLDERLSADAAKRHIVMCHPPLLAHNPQRTAEMTPYLPKEQDLRLQSILEKHGNVLFLSGHTHFAPTVERDERRSIIYLNDGSINPTVAGTKGETQTGNVFLWNPDVNTGKCIFLDSSEVAFPGFELSR